MSKKPLKVIAGAPDRPLVIGEIEISAYVLEDETRVLTQDGFLKAIGRKGNPKKQFFQTPVFLSATNIKPFISNDLMRSSMPIKFQGPSGIWSGYKAILLPQVCEVFLKAKDCNALRPNQYHIAERAELLIRGLASVGIIALVDEATGYQRIREERALATILEKFVAKELQPWTKTFPMQFYEQICCLRGWPSIRSVKRPSYFGHYTNDFVYSRLAPGVLNELRRKNPALPKGYRAAKHHQWFTPNIGHPKLKEHLAAVIALMKAAPNWTRFRGDMNRALPKLNETMQIPFDE